MAHNNAFWNQVQRLITHVSHSWMTIISITIGAAMVTLVSCSFAGTNNSSLHSTHRSRAPHSRGLSANNYSLVAAKYSDKKVQITGGLTAAQLQTVNHAVSVTNSPYSVDTSSSFPYKPHQYLVSLGASIAAGVGLKPAYNDGFPRMCGQSQASYAYLMAQKLSLKLDQVACSGARTSVGLLASQKINQVTLPAQIRATEAKVPGSIVTIFMGADNTNWIHMQYVCLTRGCPIKTPDKFTQGLPVITADIEAAVKDLRAERAKAIIVNQYYAAVAMQTTDFNGCSAYALQQGDLDFYYARLDQLNNAIAKGVNAAGGALLVDPNFSGHYICDSQPWVQSTDDSRPLHPTAAGQAEIAKLDEAALHA
jgi:hypothetical protein